MAANSPPAIKGYEFVAPIGSGGMGEVWLARDLELDRPVAIKLLSARVSTDPALVARLRLEARTASALNHPNVCTIHALGSAADGQLFLAMEYVEGVPLREHLTTRRLSVQEAIDIAGQIAAGLGAAHAAGVVHRDVKPENLMIRSDGLVKVLDFGLAKLDPTFVAGGPDRQTHTALSTGGAVAGTIAYMSPEQAAGRPIDARTDIFALGTVLYEMVTGQPPFGRGTPALVYDGILNRAPVAPSQLNPEVSPRLEDVILKALEKDRQLRYQTIVELRTDLLRLQRTSGHSGAGEAPPIEPVRDAHASRRIGRVARLSGAVLVLGLGAVALSSWPSLGRLLFTPEWNEVQLTTNSSENPVVAAAISPDGKYLAFADSAGLHLRQVDGGETNTIATPDIRDINRVMWFPDGSRLLVSALRTTQPIPAIWSISILAGAPRHLRDGGMEACVSRSGSQIAFIDSERKQLWVMGINGEDPRVVVRAGTSETLYLPGFTMHDSAVGYGRIRVVAGSDGLSRVEASGEHRDRDGRTTVAFTDPGLTAGLQLSADRWLYSVNKEPALNRNASLWEGRLDSRSGRILPNRHLHDWPGMSVLELTSSDDGGRVAFLKQSLQKDVYVAELTADGEAVNPKRLTLDDSTDLATNWTVDSQAVLFMSDRNGTFDIFRQRLDQRGADAVIVGTDDEAGPSAVSPDGAWFYYLASPKGWRLAPARGQAIMRTPATGGARERIADNSNRHIVLCARPPARPCVLVEQADTQLSVYEVTPEGRGRKLTSTATERGTAIQADLSPDGTSVALQLALQRRIRILPLHGGAGRDVMVPRPLDGSMFFWSADSAGWYVSSTPLQYPSGTELLHIDLDGHVRVIIRQNVRDWMAAIPSPDRRHLALTRSSTLSNVWMVKGL